MSASYVCTLSGEQTLDPVVSKGGFVFDRKTIEAHIKRNKKCPKSGEPLSMDDLIPILNSGGKKATTKRMIADADTAIIDNSLIPEPVVIFASSVCSTLTSLVIFPVVLFKIVESIIFSLLPIFTGVWGLIAAFQSNWVVRTLELNMVPSTVALAGALVAIASYGVYAVGASGCSVQKAKMLPFIALLTHYALNSPLIIETPLDDMITVAGIDLFTVHQLIVGSILALALIDSKGPAVKEYFESNQKASVAMSVRLHMQQ